MGAKTKGTAPATRDSLKTDLIKWGQGDVSTVAPLRAQAPPPGAMGAEPTGAVDPVEYMLEGCLEEVIPDLGLER